MMLKKSLLPVLLTLALAGCATVQDYREGQLHYKLGLSALNDGRYQAAFVEFQKALKYDNSNEKVYNALGYTYIQFQELDKAKMSFQKAVSLDHKYSEAYNNLCLVDYGLHQYDGAIAACKKALANKLYETPDKAYYNLGKAYYRKKDYPAAVTAFKESVVRVADNYPAYYMMALALNAEGQYGPAAEALSNAVKLDPAYHGNMDKAEHDFHNGTNLPVDRADTDQLLEIFKY
ncbi:MAG: tetratricopeptide repeat protein [Nitrospiraceae bacterium]|nr:tetratricopeptide repeat protein [Nitrospiraceae bacterium]